LQLSILLKPGKYNITRAVEVDEGKELDIIGDITEDQEPRDVVLCTSGKTELITQNMSFHRSPNVFPVNCASLICLFSYLGI